MNVNFLATCITNAHKLILSARFDEAVDWCQRAIEFEPQLSEAWYNLGIAYAGLNQKPAAREAFIHASSAASESADAQNSIGLEFVKLNCELEAEECLDRAHNLNPNAPEPFCNLGLLRKNQNRLKEAASLIIQAINLAPKIPELYINLSGVLTRLELHKDAILACKKAIDLDPNSAEAWNNLAIAYTAITDHKRAIFAGQKALQLNPSINWLQGSIVQSRLKICDWAELEINRELLIAQTNNGLRCTEPGVMLMLTDDTKLQRKSATIYATSSFEPNKQKQRIFDHDRIKIGYISSDFRSHAVSFLTVGLIESHNRELFEIHGFDTGKPESDQYRDRILKAFDKTHGLYGKSSNEIIQVIQQNEIDVLFDLNGYTTGATTAALAARAAPIQINFIGYPGTMGCDFIDYIIGDRVVTPINIADGYSEKIIYLPECFQPNDHKRQIADPKCRADYGLKDEEFVFACFNQATKLTPEIFFTWISILKAIPNSKIWLAIQDEDAQQNLITLAASHGLNPERIVFAGYASYNEHLMRHRFADLMLDTYPFGGGTTTSDSLWAGTPVLTLSGQSFASRMSASLLNTLGLHELITSSLDNYLLAATKLAERPEKLKELHMRLQSSRTNSPLFDTRRYTLHLEEGILAAVALNREGLDPDHIYVKRLDQPS